MPTVCEEIMKLEPGTYVHCLEDDSYTPVEEGAEADETPCAMCEDNGAEDPFCVEVVRVEPCPLEDPEQCSSDDHHWGSGMHMVDA